MLKHGTAAETMQAKQQFCFAVVLYSRFKSGVYFIQHFQWHDNIIQGLQVCEVAFFYV